MAASMATTYSCCHTCNKAFGNLQHMRGTKKSESLCFFNTSNHWCVAVCRISLAFLHRESCLPVEMHRHAQHEDVIKRTLLPIGNLHILHRRNETGELKNIYLSS